MCERVSSGCARWEIMPWQRLEQGAGWGMEAGGTAEEEENQYMAEGDFSFICLYTCLLVCLFDSGKKDTKTCSEKDPGR